MPSEQDSDARPEWRREPERGNMIAIRVMCWCAIHVPDWLARPIVSVVALYFTVFTTRPVRQGMRSYLRRVVGRDGFAQRFRHIRCFANVAYERVQLLADSIESFRISPRTHPIIEQRLADGRGAILLGAHFGSFEALRALDRTLPGLSVRYLMFQDNAMQLTTLLERLNPEITEQVISVTNGRDAMLAVREALDDGHFVAFLGDRETDSNSRSQVTVDFFGAPVSFPRAPYQCAMMARVPLITTFAIYIGQRTYSVGFREIYDGSTVARASRGQTCEALAQDFADELAENCRRHPYNWFNFFDIWQRNGA